MSNKLNRRRFAATMVSGLLLAVIVHRPALSQYIGPEGACVKATGAEPVSVAPTHCHSTYDRLFRRKLTGASFLIIRNGDCLASVIEIKRVRWVDCSDRTYNREIVWSEYAISSSSGMIRDFRVTHCLTLFQNALVVAPCMNGQRRQIWEFRYQ